MIHLCRLVRLGMLVHCFVLVRSTEPDSLPHIGTLELTWFTPMIDGALPILDSLAEFGALRRFGSLVEDGATHNHRFTD